MSFNLAVMLAESAAAHPDKDVCAGSLTYAELDRLSSRVAHALHAGGLRRGDRVVVQMPNVPEFLANYFGILKAGMIMVPVNPLLTQYELDHITADSGAALVLRELPELTESTLDTVATSADDTAVIIYTSGTTGKPKGAMLTHFGLYMNCTVAADLFGVQEQDVPLGALPFFHIYGLSSVINCAVRYGGTIAVVPRWDTGAVLDLIARHRVTVLVGVPTMYHALLMADTSGHDLSSLRIGSSGGASMPGSLLEAFERKFGIVVLEGYGMSETASTAMMNVSAQDRRFLSVGKPIWGVQAKIVSGDGAELPPGREHVGEIVLKGHNIMSGYHADPDATAAALRDGWLHTGDLAYRDEDGFYFIVDRLKDLIIRGGFNVYPREIEEVLYTHPSIAEAAVIGRPDERLGEEVVAVVSPNPGTAVDPDELIAFCRDRLAAYKCPREVRVLDSLPKSATGKLLKKELRS